MRKSIIAVSAAVAGLSLGIIDAQAGPRGQGMGAGNLGVSQHTPGYQMQTFSGSTPPPHGASTYTPGYQMRTFSGGNPPPHGASTYAPGTVYAPGKIK